MALQLRRSIASHLLFDEPPVRGGISVRSGLRREQSPAVEFSKESFQFRVTSSYMQFSGAETQGAHPLAVLPQDEIMVTNIPCPTNSPWPLWELQSRAVGHRAETDCPPR